jgi:hypothetical protein
LVSLLLFFKYFFFVSDNQVDPFRKNAPAFSLSWGWKIQLLLCKEKTEIPLQVLLKKQSHSVTKNVGNGQKYKQ